MVGEGIALFNSDLKITNWDTGFLNLTDKKPEAVENKSLFSVLKHNLIEGEPFNTLKIDNLNKGKTLTLFFPSKGYYTASVVPFLNRNNEVEGGVCIFKNIDNNEDILTFEDIKQRQVLKAILQTQEEERKRIAEALHNSLGQLLYATKLKMESINQILSPLKFRELQSQIDKLLAEAIEETRTLSFQLTPRLLEQYGLKEAVQELVNKVSQPNLLLKLDISGFNKELKKSVELAIFRIIQELINNVLKHSKAKTAVISLSNDNENIFLKVSDDGEGFNVGELDDSKLGIGLRSIKNKLKLWEGAMQINSQPGKGTSITINIKQ